MPIIIGRGADVSLGWQDAVAALQDGHLLPRAQLRDVFLGPATATLLSRSTYIAGLGYGTKTVTVMDANAALGLPTVQGVMLVFDEQGGGLKAVIDSELVTNIKTAADSVLGARLLARVDSRRLLVVGTGVVAAQLARAYSAVFPALEHISIWSRRPEQAADLARSLCDIPVEVRAVRDLQAAMTDADIISSATMAREPVIKSAWVKDGAHVDLVGAYKADMREADDALISRGSLFVDNRETTIAHIGELLIPIRAGIITEQSILGDLYDLVVSDARRRVSDEEVTIFKNGGGCHLDLMIAARLITGGDATPVI